MDYLNAPPGITMAGGPHGPVTTYEDWLSGLRAYWGIEGSRDLVIEVLEPKERT
jgi:hypothetical protein